MIIYLETGVDLIVLCFGVDFSAALFASYVRFHIFIMSPCK